MSKKIPNLTAVVILMFLIIIILGILILSYVSGVNDKMTRFCESKGYDTMSSMSCEKIEGDILIVRRIFHCGDSRFCFKEENLCLD